MNHLNIMENEIADRISTTIWNASDALKRGKDPKIVAELLEQTVREFDAVRVELQVDSEMEDPI